MQSYQIAVISIWPVDGILIPSQSGPRSNSNEGALHIPVISTPGTSLSDAV